MIPHRYQCVLVTACVKAAGPATSPSRKPASSSPVCAPPNTPPATENRHACLAEEQVLLHRKGKEGSRGREEGRDAAPREMHDEPGSKSRHESEAETDTQRHRGREK